MLLSELIQILLDIKDKQGELIVVDSRYWYPVDKVEVETEGDGEKVLVIGLKS